MHLCFIVEGYPTQEDPFMPFVRELAAEMVKQGVKCSVIAPQSITRAYRHKLHVRPRQWTDEIEPGKTIEVFQPYYISLSNSYMKLNRLFMGAAIKGVYRKRKIEKCDAFYAHFWHMGVLAAKIKSDIPVFVACGESRIEVKDYSSGRDINRLMARLSGIVYVGTKSLKDSIALGLQNQKPYIIAPNGYNKHIFMKMDRERCREILGWPQNAFIVSFVGSFNDRKGIDRLNEAIKESKEVIYSCFIGNGEIKPDCENILFCGKLPHDDIPKYLNASDVFALPTNNEGCCNAIVEALACGLPVISSNQSFNDDILDSDCSIRVDPMNIREIKDAIFQMIVQKDRVRYAEGAIKKAKELSIESRAHRIICFIQKVLNVNGTVI